MLYTFPTGVSDNTDIFTFDDESGRTLMNADASQMLNNWKRSHLPGVTPGALTEADILMFAPESANIQTLTALVGTTINQGGHNGTP